jgi:hypothetical protein
VGNRAEDLFRGKQVLLEEGLEQDAAHFARAQNSDAYVWQLRRNLSGLYGYLCHFSLVSFVFDSTLKDTLAEAEGANGGADAAVLGSQRNIDSATFTAGDRIAGFLAEAVVREEKPQHPSPRSRTHWRHMVKLDRTKANPWQLKTPPGTSEYTMHMDEKDGVRVVVCTVGKTVLLYDTRCIEDLHAMLKTAGDWVELGGADEQKPAKDGTVEAWGRSASNPVKGWYGLKKGLRGRFGVYVPPLMEELGLCELEHNAKNNRMRAK